MFQTWKSFAGHSVGQRPSSKDRWVNAFPVEQIFQVHSIANPKYKYSKCKASQMLEVLQKCLNLKFCCHLFIQDWSKWVRWSTPPTAIELSKSCTCVIKNHHLYFSLSQFWNVKRDPLCTSRNRSSFYSPRAAAKLSNDTWEEQQHNNEKNMSIDSLTDILQECFLPSCV